MSQRARDRANQANMVHGSVLCQAPLVLKRFLHIFHSFQAKTRHNSFQFPDFHAGGGPCVKHGVTACVRTGQSQANRKEGPPKNACATNVIPSNSNVQPYDLQVSRAGKLTGMGVHENHPGSTS